MHRARAPCDVAPRGASLTDLRTRVRSSDHAGVILATRRSIAHSARPAREELALPSIALDSPSYRPKIAALVVIALMVAMMTGTARYLDGQRAEAASEASAAYDSSLALQALLTAMVDSETGQRGYLLMREETYLAPYHQARGEMDDALTILRARFTDEELADLESDAADAVQLLDHAIELTDADRFAEAKALVSANRRSMDRVRADLATLESIETHRRLVAEERRADAASDAALMNVIGSVIVVALLLLLAATIRSDILVITEQNGRLAALGKELGDRRDRLEAMTQTLAKQNDQLAERNTALAGAMRERAHAMLSLERRNRDLDQFAYVTSHDLKAPLRAISNLAGWIEEDLGEAAPAPVREHVTLLKQRTERMNTLIEGVLAYSRAGRSATSDAVSLAGVVEEVRNLLGLEGGAVVTLGEDLRLQTDRTQLQQVLQNLTSNARKHAPEATKPIEISWGPSEDEGFVEIAVRDHGPGIDPRFHEKIFEIFQTLNARDKVESTGIGLAIVKKIVQGQGGRVGVESEPGQGARFVFTWPSVSPPGEASDASEGAIT